MVSKIVIAMAFDFGTTNIGIAVGQSITYTAQPITTIKNNYKIPILDKLIPLINIWSPNILIVGLPINMDCTEQSITIKARNFANLLNSKFNISVELHDERLTTKEAYLLLKNKCFKINKMKNNIVNQLSAVLILESWFRKKFFQNY
ncbi:MAG: Holliday junction resolvase RuvX [Candidatus Lightella neohaematopini]|nr:Holliday junction resolvase RuvX [Candidatus Lightella neohaematopini]MCV2528773.1 Holliday junction resolvase RuvX [Candidatus Lightella neohaematopini]